MAKVLEDYQFRGRGPKPEIDFEKYELGVTYKIEKGVDFQGSVDHVRNRLYGFARSRGYEATTEIIGVAVIFRLSKPAEAK